MIFKHGFNLGYRRSALQRVGGVSLYGPRGHMGGSRFGFRTVPPGRIPWGSFFWTALLLTRVGSGRG